MSDLNEQPAENGADRISDGLESVANLTDVLGSAGVKTGKAGFWLRVGSTIAGLFGKKKK